MKFTRALCTLVLGLLAAAAAASAQVSPESVFLSIAWSPPTTGGAGTVPLTGVNAINGFNIYTSTVALTAVPAAPSATATATQTTAGANVMASVGQTIYVYVTACDSTGCSGLSAPATYVWTGQPAAPDSPTAVKIVVATPATG
jgi:hypothetical protein